MVLEAITYTPHTTLRVLDQLQLPHKTHYDDVRTTTDGWLAINSMRVRGAPAIAMVGILSLAVELHNTLLPTFTTAAHAAQTIDEKLTYIVTSRPTAVNLRNMARDFSTLVHAAAKQPNSTPTTVCEAYLTAAQRTLETDRNDNKRLGDHGAEWIVAQRDASNSSSTQASNSSSAQLKGGTHSGNDKDKNITILTHCNTGSLATAGYGTALGVIRSLHSLSRLARAYCTETRPYNQGSRLTAYELLHDSIPATLITDSMAAALMNTANSKSKGEGQGITAVVVGADRIAGNGDTANKIGTYTLAIAAKEHGVRFVVAAPCSTVDLGMRSGQEIVLEERRAEEMTTISGPVIGGEGKLDLENPAQRVSIAAEGISVWNPAFDVTPARLIDAIVTEKGVVVKKEGAAGFDMAEICER